MKTELKGQASPEQIEGWKNAHRGFFGIEVGGHIAYFREPELDDLNIAASQVDSDTPLDFNRIIMQECLLGGSEAILNEKNLFMGASKIMSKKIDGEKAKLVEF